LGPALRELFNRLNRPSLALVGRVRIAHRGVDVGMTHHGCYRVYGYTGIRSPSSKCVAQIMKVQIVKTSIPARIIERGLDIRYIGARLSIGKNEFAGRRTSQT
jgi:hypothetical protein